MRFAWAVPQAAGGRGSRTGLRGAALLCGAFAVLSAHAVDAPDPKKPTVIPGDKCASVVIRNCRARFVPDPSVPAVETRPPARANDAPGRWEAVRTADPDDDAIVVEEDRLRDPTIQEVFERYLGPPPGGYRTRSVAGGARCTTINSTGATLCTAPINQAPTSSLPHTDFSDGAF